MSEIDTRASGALAPLAPPSPEFIERFPALDDTGDDLIELLAENLGGDGNVSLSIGDFVRVKVPAGGGVMWEVPDPETGEQDAAKTITGVVVHRASRRSFWPTKEINGTPPTCRSRDLRFGEGEYGPGSPRNPTGSCQTCPMSQRGSMKEIDPTRGDSQASACKQQELMFLLPPNELLPWMVTIPPGSLAALRKFMLQQISLRRLDYRQVEITLGLQKVKGDGTPDYSQVVFSKGAKLGPAEHAAVKAFGIKLGKLIEEQAEAVDAAVDGVDPAAAGATVVDEPVDYEPGQVPEDEVELPTGKVGKGR